MSNYPWLPRRVAARPSTMTPSSRPIGDGPDGEDSSRLALPDLSIQLEKSDRTQASPARKKSSTQRVPFTESHHSTMIPISKTNKSPSPAIEDKKTRARRFTAKNREILLQKPVDMNQPENISKDSKDNKMELKTIRSDTTQKTFTTAQLLASNTNVITQRVFPVDKEPRSTNAGKIAKWILLSSADMGEKQTVQPSDYFDMVPSKKRKQADLQEEEGSTAPVDVDPAYKRPAPMSEYNLFISDFIPEAIKNTKQAVFQTFVGPEHMEECKKHLESIGRAALDASKKVVGKPFDLTFLKDVLDKQVELHAAKFRVQWQKVVEKKWLQDNKLENVLPLTFQAIGAPHSSLPHIKLVFTDIIKRYYINQRYRYFHGKGFINLKLAKIKEDIHEMCTNGISVNHGPVPDKILETQLRKEQPWLIDTHELKLVNFSISYHIYENTYKSDMELETSYKMHKTTP